MVLMRTFSRLKHLNDQNQFNFCILIFSEPKQKVVERNTKYYSFLCKKWVGGFTGRNAGESGRGLGGVNIFTIPR